MIRLSDGPAGPVELDLGLGVSVTCRPLSSALYRAALAQSIRELAALQKRQAEQGEAVPDSSPILEPDLSDPDVAAATGNALLVTALAMKAIVAWEGIEGPDGAALDPTPDNISRLMTQRPSCADGFWARYGLPLWQREQEGNGSAPSRNGTSAAAPGTAKAAKTSKGGSARKSARAKTARTSPRRSARKGRRPTSS